MTITAITGDIGSGKSFKQLHQALFMCHRYKKSLVTNFGLNLPAIKRYAAKKKMPWLCWMCDNDQVRVLDLTCTEQLVDLLSTPNSVVCLDEAGIFLNTRDFSKTPKSLLKDLAQSRKTGCDLVYAAQFDGQVDKQFRLLTQYFIHAEGTTIWDAKLRNQRLVWKKYYSFTSQKYWTWVEDAKKRSSLIRSWLAADATEMGPLTTTDSMLFDCFESFSRLDTQSQNVLAKRESYTEDELLALAVRTQSSCARWRKKALRDKALIDKDPLNRLFFSLKRLRQLKNL